MKIYFTLCSTLLFLTLHAQNNKAGTLDSSFGINGKVLAHSDSGYLDCTGAGAQTDGSIIAAGGTSFIGSGTNDFFALKYSSDGKQDTSFGTHGIAVMAGLGLAQAIKVQPDNKIVIAGYNSDIFGTYYVITVGRLNADGSIDSTFGTNGGVTTNLGEDCSDIAIQPDGKILITGDNGVAILTLRYMPDGTPDKSFGDNGSVITAFNGQPKTGSANIVQPDGKIVVVGGDGKKIMLARYNIDGSLDESFGTNGEVISDISKLTYPFNSISDMAIQPDGKFLLVGSTGNTSGIDNALLLRYMPNGSLDSTFGNKGITIENLQYNSIASSVALQKDNKILISGYYKSDGINAHFLLARYNTDGSIDSSFGNNGNQVTVMDHLDGSLGIILQSDGKIVLGGFASSTQTGPAQEEVALACYYNDESKKQILIAKIRHWIQHHNGFTWDANSNISNYVVQRSYDGIHFSSIARINAGNSSNYTYEDPSPLSGNNYYRLQTTSINGAVNYSNVLAVANNDIKVSPNPATNSLHIEGLSSSNTKFTVVDFSGNIKLQTTANTSSYNLNIASLKPGNYLLKIEMNNDVITKKFLKE